MQVYDAEVNEDSVTIYCPDKEIRDRADTVDGMLVSVKFSSPMEDIICVKLDHFIGSNLHEPKFDIKNDYK